MSCRQMSSVKFRWRLLTSPFPNVYTLVLVNIVMLGAPSFRNTLTRAVYTLPIPLLLHQLSSF
jgi:hypothetical protein